MKRFFKSAIILFSVLWAISGFGAGQLEISNIYQFVESFETVRMDYGQDEILVVFDIDNTLLAMDGDLGSDQWWNWQRSLQKSSLPGDEKKSQGMISDDFMELLGVQGFLFESRRMKPTEIALPSIVKALQDLGVGVVGLTSRGPEFQTATFRELYRNGYHLDRSGFDGSSNYLSELPYKVSDLQGKYGFSSEEVAGYGLESPRPVLFTQGVYFTSGQHKGAFLRILLKQLGISPKLILFIDDHKRNTSNVWDAYYGKGNVDLYTYRYGAHDEEVLKFNQSDKKDVIQEWQNIYSPKYKN